jgi:hypothetical protein
MALTRRARRSEIALAPAGKQEWGADWRGQHEARHGAPADARLVRFPGLRPAGGNGSGECARSRPASSLFPACFSATECDRPSVRDANGPALAGIEGRMHAGRTINCRRDHRPNRSLRPIVSLLRATAGFQASLCPPILLSVPLISRAMLARCMIHNSAVSNVNSTASGRSPMSHTTNGLAALARSAASEE